jgi:hypothetical protein
MKKLVLCLAVASLLLAGVQANALIGTIDDVPAATLLLPYFEVNLDDVNGVQTLFSINNASDVALLAHVVVWSDLSVPVLDFNIYLTGYDVVTINLRDIFVTGNLPRTADLARDPGDVISNQGLFSADVTFPSCAGFLPPPQLPQDFIDHLQNSLTGQASGILNGLCAGQRLNDRIARGYITVDTVNACNLDFPFTPGYFINGGLGTATNQNVLWGDYFYVNAGQNFAQGETLVHIEACPGTGLYPTPGTFSTWGTYPQGGCGGETDTTGEYTFYGRYVAWTAADNREPLGTNFAVRFLNGGIFSGGTDILSWRDAKVNQGAFTCPATAGVRPPWYPLGQEQIVIFDEEENPEVPTTLPVSPPRPGTSLIPFPAEANRTPVDGPGLPVTPTFGWLYLNLNHTELGNPNPPEDPLAAQAWVTAVMDAEGRFSVGFDAIQLDNATEANHALVGGGAPASN